MEKSITLNLTYSLVNDNSDKIQKVYENMYGWLNDPEWAYWFGKHGDSQYITVSSEPSGLIVSGVIEDTLWTSWLTVFCSKLTLSLGVEIHDTEM